jgi:phenylacetate-CoA oxygenase PaaJ subunit
MGGITVAAPSAAGLLEALRDVEDPEIPISVVDMGLIVDLRVSGGVVDVAITFTAMGCPAMEMIIDDVRARLFREPGVEEVRVDVVWEPIWTKERLTEDGKAAMREWGISV